MCAPRRSAKRRRVRVVVAGVTAVVVLAAQQARLAEAQAAPGARPVTPTQHGSEPSVGSGRVSAKATKADVPVQGRSRDVAPPKSATPVRSLAKTHAKRSVSPSLRHAAHRVAAPNAPGKRGFSPTTSVLVPKLSTPNRRVYANRDGTMTASITAATNPTSTQTDVSSTYVQSSHSANHANDGFLYVGPDDDSQRSTYLAFLQVPSLSYSTTSPGPLQNAYVLSANVTLDAVVSSLSRQNATCAPSTVTAAALKDPWSAASLTTYPGPTKISAGPVTYATFGGTGTGVAKNCPKKGATYGSPTNINIPVTQIVQDWVHGWLPNHGLGLTAENNFAEFSTTGANKPTLTVTYTPYGDGANYAETSYVAPVNNQPGSANVLVQNEGSTAWTPTNGYKLDYSLFKISGTTRTAVTSPASIPAVMPKTVAPGQQVQLSPQLPALPPATYAVCWTMRDTTHSTLFTALGVPTTCYGFVVQNNPPVFDSFSPDNNALAYTLTPTLTATAHDPDHYPANATLTYAFQLYNSAGTMIASRTASPVDSWSVPAKTLTYGNVYNWRVQAGDTSSTSPWSAPAYFTVPSAQQPLITSHLGAAPYDATVKGVDPSVGNYSTAVTDARVPDVPGVLGLEITRTYNSLDPREGNFFGAGWSTTLDMRAQPDTDGTGSILITLDDGRQERFAYNPDGSYSPPLGVKAWLTSVSGGFRLVDDAHRVFTFTRSTKDPVTNQPYYGLVSEGVAESPALTTLAWGTVSLRGPDGTSADYVVPQSLTGTGATAAGLQFAYSVQRITTATSATVLLPQVRTASIVAPTGKSGPTQTWTYGYDDAGTLTSVCPPTSPSSCTTYSYSSGANSGSHFASMVSDSNPRNYYRLADPAGTSTTADSVVSHEGTTEAVPHDVTFGAASHLPGSPSTTATFNGTSSWIGLPNNLLGGNYLSCGMWFQTTATGETLLGNQDAPPGGTAGAQVPVIYVGTDGKVHATLWDGNRATADSASAVNDGKWHYVVLSGSGTTQTLFVDGVASTPRSGAAFSYNPSRGIYALGAGRLTTASPSAPDSPQGFFRGSISDFWYAEHPIGLPQVQQEYGAGIASARTLTRITLASGKQGAAMTYDAAADRVRTVTSGDGGTWTLPPSTTKGTAGYYAGQLASTLPYDTWALDETDGATAVDGSTGLDTNYSSDDGTYNDVTHNPSGLFGTDGPGSASFNGTSSYVNLPSYALPTYAPSPTINLWLRTTTPGGTLIGTQDTIYPATPTKFLPVLYIGTDGKIHGGYYTDADYDNDDGSNRHQLAITSKTVVTDGKWHMITLAAASRQFQEDSDPSKYERLFVDGVQEASAGEITGAIPGVYPDNSLYSTQIGVGSSTGFPASSSATNPGGFFQGDLAQVAFWNRNIPTEYPGSVGALFKSRGSATGLTPTTLQTVQDPNGGTSTYQFDPIAGNRTIAYTDATGATTRFAYDDRGFQSGVTDANNHTTAYRRDALGDLVWSRRCRTDSDCQTTSATYNTAVGPTAYTSGKPLTRTDPLGATTTYAYDAATGQRTKTTGPATTDFPSGRSTSYTYTTTSTATADGSAGLPDLPTTTTDPRGSVTMRDTYYSGGQLASESNALGARTTYAYDSNSYGVATATNYSSEYPSGVATTYTYDAQNRVVTETLPPITDAVTGVTHTRRTTYARDVDGNVTSESISDLTGGDPARVTTYTYTGGNRVASVTDPNGHKTSYGYDAVGNNTSETRPDGTVLEHLYTARNELKATQLDGWVADPSNPTQTSTLTLDARRYDPAGNLAGTADSMGRVTGYLYDNDNTLAGVARAYTTPDQTFEKYARDANGRVLTYSSGCVAGSDGFDVCQDSRYLRYDAAGLMTISADDQQPATINGATSYVFRDRHDYTYDADGNVLTDSESSDDRGYSSKAAPASAKITYAYDALNDQTQQSVANGSSTLVTKQGYSTAGLPVSGTDANGHTTTTHHNALGQADLTQLPAVPVETVGSSPTTVAPQAAVGYDTFGDVEAAEDQNGNITQSTFDGVGNVKAQRGAAYTAPGATTALTPTTTFDYDSMDRLTTTTDPLGRKTTVGYDQLGNAVSATQPGNLTTLATFDTDGERLSQTSPTGARHESTYDNLGRRITDTDVVRQPTSTAYTTSYKYDALSNQVEIDRPIGKETSTYSGIGEKVTDTDALGRTTSFAYGLPNQPTATTLPDKTATTMGYDAAGRMTSTSEVDATGKAVRTAAFGYDSAGNRTSTTDPQGNVTRYTYDAGDRLASQAQPAAGSTTLTSTFGYDAAGNRTRWTNPNGQSTGYTVNSWNLPESTVAPAIAGDTALADRATTSTYDVLGRTTGATRPGGVKVADSYDAAGRLTGQSGSGAEAATANRSFGYDGDGRLTSASSPKGASTYTYDDRGLMLSASGGGGLSTFAYNGMGWLTSRTDDAGTANFAYDAQGNVATQSGPATYSASYTYDAVDEPTKIDYGSSVGSRTMTYSPTHQLASDTTSNPAGTALRTATYAYNATGQQTAQTTKVPATGYSSSTTSTFDPAGRLASWTNGSATSTYSYDGDGNLLTDGTTTSKFNERDQLTQQSSGGTTTTFGYSLRGTLATSTSGATTTSKYDAFDQQVSSGANTYAYDALGRLATASEGANSYSFTYDGLGSQVTSDGTQKFGRGAGGDLVSLQTSGGGGGAVLTNPHGDDVGTLNSSGIAGNAAYSPTGKVITSSGVLANLGFQGDWTDPATSSVRTASRWYSPGTGEFTSADSQQNNPDPAVHANPYTYGDDDPTDKSDTSGHDACGDHVAKVQANLDRIAKENAALAKQHLQWALDAAKRNAEWAAEDARDLAKSLAGIAAHLAGLRNYLDVIKSWHPGGGSSGSQSPRNQRLSGDDGGDGAGIDTLHNILEFGGAIATLGFTLGRSQFGDNLLGTIAGFFEGGELAFSSSDRCLTEKAQDGASKEDSGVENQSDEPPNRSNDRDPLHDKATDKTTRGENTQTVQAEEPGQAAEDASGTSDPNTAGNTSHESPPKINDAPEEPGTEPTTDESSAEVPSDESPQIDSPYERPSGATTAEQRASVQGQPCVDCGETTDTQVADHKYPLVQEYYENRGLIDLERMRSPESVQPQCPLCSARQGASYRNYSNLMRELFGLDP